jgi:hypothetical protein
LNKKVYEFSAEPFHLRRNFWKENVLEFAQIDFVDAPYGREQLEKDMGSIFNAADAAFVTEAYSKIFLEQFKVLPRNVLEVKKMDALFKQQSKLWPRCLMRESIHELIVKRAPHLSTNAKAYVTGSDSTMRVALSALVQLGFRQISIVVDEAEMLSSHLREIKNMYFGVDIDVIKNSNLTMQPNNGTVLVNTIKLDGRRELIEDLSYLNFIFSNGLVVETNLFPLNHLLLEEAKNVGLSVIHGYEIRGKVDWLFLQALFGKISISYDDYLVKWKDFLEKNKP